MKHSQPLEAIQVITSNHHVTSETGPSLQRASILFIASVSFLVGVSLLLASI